MHLAVDAVGVKHSGGAAVLVEFLETALGMDGVTRVTVFTSPRRLRTFDLPAAAHLVESEHDLCDRSYAVRIHWCLRGLPAACRRMKPDVVFCMTGMGCATPDTPHATFIQQSLPFCPEALMRLRTVERVRFALIRRLMQRSCRMARVVIVQTPTMRSSIQRAFDIDPHQIAVFRAPARDLSSDETIPGELSPMLGIPASARLLYVGNDMPYKNVDLVIAALGQLRERVPGATLFATWPRTHPLCSRAGVIGLGYLNGGSLARAYTLATVLVQPSLAETSSLPLHEAMAKGTPIIAADRPYAHDECDDAAIYFDPLSTNDFVSTAAALLLDEGLRVALADRGRIVAAKRRAEEPYRRMVDALRRIATPAAACVAERTPSGSS